MPLGGKADLEFEGFNMAIRKQNPSAESIFFKECFEVVKSSCLKILGQYGDLNQNDKLSISLFDETQDMSHDHWVCSITVHLGEAQVFLKAHYETRLARYLAAKGTQLEPADIPVHVIESFMQEFLNMVMGQIKFRYKSPSIDVSIPEILPNYDQGTHNEPLDIDHKGWKIDFEPGAMIFMCYVLISGDVTKIEEAKSLEEEEKEQEASVFTLL